MLSAYLGLNGVADTWERVLRPVLAAVGALWSELPHAIAVEHLLSHVATVALGETVPLTSGGGSAVLLACAPDELHDLPLVALTAALSAADVPVTLLGARTPRSALIAASARNKPAAVVVLALTGERPISRSSRSSRPRLWWPPGPGGDPRAVPASARYVNDLVDATTTLVDQSGRRR